MTPSKAPPPPAFTLPGADLGVWLQLGGLHVHHDGHGVRLLGQQPDQRRARQVVVLVVRPVLPLNLANVFEIRYIFLDPIGSLDFTL